MAKDFVLALSILKVAEPIDVINALREFFREITTYNLDETIVSYQTTKIAAQVAGLESNPIIISILDAVEAQMLSLGPGSGFIARMDHSGRRERIELVLGRSLTELDFFGSYRRLNHFFRF